MSPSNDEPVGREGGQQEADRDEQARASREHGPDERRSETSSEPLNVEGERGKPAVNRFRSVQSRVSSILTVSLLSALALGLMAWYYAHTFSVRSGAREASDKALQRRIQNDAPVPPLGRIEPPQPNPFDVKSLLGEKPQIPEVQPIKRARASGVRSVRGAQKLSPEEAALQRKLQGPVFVRAGDSSERHAQGTRTRSLTSDASTRMGAGSLSALTGGATSESSSDDSLASYLKPTVLAAAQAKVLPTRRFLLAKGTPIDCTLQTAINSQLPGIVTCITSTDTYSADGTVVLLEQGTQLFGETRGQVKEGMSRLFVLWSEARTPAGVVVPLASPATDALGRAGLAGHINRHFWQRFGAAILITIIDGASQSLTRPRGNGGIVINPAGSRDVATEILRSTRNIPPTLDKHQGEIVKVLVARDVDFRSVYDLTLTAQEAPDER